ncbi:MAG: O-antigen ligase family protein [Pseudomonas sp.]|uniref:O-antigen ligase family protein n=1 Tax=Pseudomonas sp. TaxID=306 RepID=UPI003D136984
MLVLVVRGGDEPTRDMKVVFYVTLSLLGFLLAARAGEASIERLLLWAALLGGVGAGLSWLNFYGLEQNPLSNRLIAVGIWDTVIMAAHAVGALAVVGLTLVVGRSWRRAWLLPAGVAALGYMAFLLSSQTRGVWLALLASLMVILLAVPWRVGLTVLLCLLLAVAAVAIYDVQLLLQRGFSYRPALWAGGLQLITENTWWGLGFHEFKLALPELNKQFKHPHNLFIDTGVRLGVVGLLLFCGLWLLCLWRAWEARGVALGRALLALWLFATVSLMTDGIGLWRKPNADWLITWLPIALGFVLAQRRSAISLSKLESSS